MEELLGLLGLGAAGGLLTGNAYSRLGDIGDQTVTGFNVGGTRVPGALEIGEIGRQQAEFRPFTVASASPFGGSINTDQFGGITYGLGGQEQALSQGLLTGAQGFYDRAMQDPAMREADVYERIRALQRPEEQRLDMGLEERLFNQGRLGVQTNMYGGTPEQLALSKAREEAKNQAALMALQQGNAEALQNVNLGQSLLAGSYVPQAQLLASLNPALTTSQIAQRGQLGGAELYGEGLMSGLQGRLSANLGQANLLGNLGSGILSGLFSPVNTSTGVGSLFTDIIGGL